MTDSSSKIDLAQLRRTLRSAKEVLLSRRAAGGHWEGCLSGSALSTVTAVFALGLVGDAGDRERVDKGLSWLISHQNADGGWGDTVRSLSNLSTTALCWAALGVDSTGRCRQAQDRATKWIVCAAGGVEPDTLVRAIAGRYGEDRTFSAPILSMLALAGRLGEDGWRHVMPLPFELAVLPHGLFRFLRLQVVSYALPALIAVGQARSRQCPGGLWRLVRRAVEPSTLRLLDAIQPPSGGYLEAAPLTSFVLMNLSAGRGGANAQAVTRRGLDFLRRSMRPDGSWPIDTNLATWVTTLSVNALAGGDDFEQLLPAADRRSILDWLLAQQHRREHPYTHADPGGWAWTDLDGGVPDADDTPGALLAVRNLGPSQAYLPAARTAVEWLLGIQNSDGGIPTFCRGWGKLPFDRSSADLTAHSLAAMNAWRADMPADLQPRIATATTRMERFLSDGQGADGQWNPLWFGNQFAAGDGNPVYGTAKVLLALPAEGSQARRGAAFLLSCQNADGGWGGQAGVASSIEETAVAVDALAKIASGGQVDVAAAIARGARHLAEATQEGTVFEPSPIGLYFAKLWYYEELYPIIFTVAALNRAERLMSR